jgi:hypothetical protein
LYSMFKLIFYYMFIIFLRNYSPEAKTNEPWREHWRWEY